jgi:hypothetical protein
MSGGTSKGHAPHCTLKTAGCAPPPAPLCGAWLGCAQPKSSVFGLHTQCPFKKVPASVAQQAYLVPKARFAAGFGLPVTAAAIAFLYFPPAHPNGPPPDLSHFFGAWNGLFLTPRPPPPPRHALPTHSEMPSISCLDYTECARSPRAEGRVRGFWGGRAALPGRQ